MTTTDRARTAHPGAEVVTTTCWECSTLCGALVTTSGGRVVNVGPDPDHPASEGAFCVKGMRGLTGTTYGLQRILHPLRRVGERGSGRFERISWDDALDAMAAGFAKAHAMHGPMSLVGAVSGAFFSRGAVMALLMRSLGSPNWMINQDLCGGCRGVSDMVTGLGITGGEDIDHARCVLVVGANLAAASPVQWMRLKRAKARGARVVVLDPFRTPVADLADLWLRPVPGTDAAIALAMIDVMVREQRHDAGFVEAWCHGFPQLAARAAQFPPARAAAISGVPETDIVAAARHFAEGPSVFVSGHGIDAMSNGVQTFRAFHALVAIAGFVDRPGGNRRAKRPAGMRSYLDVIHDPQFRLPRDIERQALGADRYPLWAGPEGWQTACHNPTVLDAMLTGRPYPVRAMLVSGVNIAVTYPDTARTLAALRSLDFLAVATHTMTPTAAVADIVLPKTTGLEEEEVTVQQHGPLVSYTRAVIASEGEARCDLDIARGLLDRMQALGAAVADFLPWRTQRAFNEYLLGDSGITIAQLERDGSAAFDFAMADPVAQPIRTPTGKFELYSERMAAHGLDPLPDYVPPRHLAERSEAYPLLLQTGAREKAYHHSRYREQDWARRLSPDPVARIHPATARTQGVAEGQWVRIEVAGGPGACRHKVAISDRVPEGMVVTGMGWWNPAGAAPLFDAMAINVNAALSYAGPWDPVSGSTDTRGLACRLTDDGPVNLTE